MGLPLVGLGKPLGFTEKQGGGGALLGQEAPAGVPLVVGPTGAGLDVWPYISPSG
jgi:hypothetical protein